MKKCKDCGKNHIGKNKLCPHCSELARKRAASRVKRLNVNGVCSSCGKNKKLPSSVRCRQCKDKMDKKNSERLKAYIEQNRCSTCGRDKSKVLAWHTSRCPGCHLKYKFSFTGTKKEAEDIINELLENQNLKCALTGRCLNENKYHIDHIIPKSLDGKDEPSNWQLIVDEANVFKTNMTMGQVIKLAADIVQHSGV